MKKEVHPIHGAVVTVVMIVFCAVFVTAFIFRSAREKHSPMDSYIQGALERYEDGTRHANEVKAYLDSLHTYIDNKNPS
jgi:hypothetical protein